MPRNEIDRNPHPSGAACFSRGENLRLRPMITPPHPAAEARRFQAVKENAKNSSSPPLK